jgi:hypothetical protein
MKFAEKVPDNFGISEIPKKSFLRNLGKFPRHFPKFPDFPKIPEFSGNLRKLLILSKKDVFGILT